MRILTLDIETKYLEAAVWGLWNNNVSLNQLLDSGMILCWAAKWLHEPKKHIMWVRHDEDDFLQGLHELLTEADAVLTYNGRRFDLPTINREFVKAGLGPPAPYRHIDLLETVKKAFRLPSNKMDFISQDLGIGKKISHEGFPLWIKCCEGDEKAWNKMRRYNIQDVLLLEKLYRRLGPWVQAHPNAALYKISEGAQLKKHLSAVRIYPSTKERVLPHTSQRVPTDVLHSLWGLESSTVYGDPN